MESCFRSPPPRYGADSRHVLLHILGFSTAEVDAMVSSGVVGEGWSDAYIPVGDPWVNSEDEYDAFIHRVEEGGKMQERVPMMSKL